MLLYFATILCAPAGQYPQHWRLIKWQYTIIQQVRRCNQRFGNFCQSMFSSGEWTGSFHKMANIFQQPPHRLALMIAGYRIGQHLPIAAQRGLHTASKPASK